MTFSSYNTSSNCAIAVGNQFSVKSASVAPDHDPADANRIQHLKGEVRRNIFIGSKFESDPNKEKFQ